jgi:hypothetical protein
MDDERDDVPWKDPPEEVRELILAARELPPMTAEEEDRAVARAQQALAALRRTPAPAAKRQSPRRIAVVAAVALGAVLMVLGIAAGVHFARGPGDIADRPAASGVPTRPRSPR